MLILDLWGISFHAVVVFALGKNFLFIFVLGQVEKKMPRIIYVITLRVRKKSRLFVFWENLWQANLLSVEYHLYAELKDLFDGLFPWKLHLFGPILRPD